MSNVGNLLVIYLDDQGRVTGFNRACQEIAGYTFEEVAGRPFWDVFFASGTAASAKLAFFDSCAGQACRETEDSWLTKDGGQRRIRWSYTASTTSKPDFLVVGIDLTDTTRTEEQLQTESILLSQTQDALMVRDLEDRITFWNKGAERLYGWQADEAIGKNIYDLLAPAFLPGSEAPERALIEQGEWIGETRQITKDRREIIVNSRWKLMRDHAGQAKSVVIATTDLTERKMIEFQLLRAQRIETNGRLTGSILHDLNNELAPMLVSIRNLQQELMDPKSGQWLETLRISVERAALLIKHFPSFDIVIKDERTSIQLREVVEETIEMMRSAFPKSIEMKLALSPDLWNITGNTTGLQQVVMNLFINARDAMPCGGTLNIASENVLLDQIDVPKDVSRSGRYVVFTVADTGISMPISIVNKGLGLFNVCTIVRDHGGFVTVSSKPGEGTEFRIYFPAEN